MYLRQAGSFGWNEGTSLRCATSMSSPAMVDWLASSIRTFGYGNAGRHVHDNQEQVGIYAQVQPIAWA